MHIVTRVGHSELEGSTGPPKPDCPRAEPRTEPVRSENIDLSLGAGSGRVQLLRVRFGGGSKCFTSKDPRGPEF